MKAKIELYVQKFHKVRHLVFRNIFLLINIIIFTVVALLFYFGDVKEGVFLGIILFINTVVGITRDVRAWLALERLQMLTAVRVVRVNEDGTENYVLSEEIKKGDKIKLKLGDQVPCDGTIIFAKGLQVNEGVITGESNSFSKFDGEKIFAGSIVTSGVSLILTDSAMAESRIAKMTQDIKKYSKNISPIQHSINTIVKYFGYVLLVAITIEIYIGISTGQSGVSLVKEIGALSSMLVPQGLVIAVTIMFAYGAVYSFKRNVLLQDMNAIEKLGRIKNLCIDKTGTLTENMLTVENIHIPENVEKNRSLDLVSVYVEKSGDLSETIFAIKKFIENKFNGEIIDAIPFNSSRRFGAVLLGGKYQNTVVLAGAPETFMDSLDDSKQKKWIENLIKINTAMGKRIIAFAQYKAEVLPENLSGVGLSLLAVFVLHNELRQGIADTVDFFQDRGVHIRVISGDNPETVRAISVKVGIKNTEAIVTGPEIEKWSNEEFENNIRNYNIYARVKPEQKEKIIEALKKDGFTAMVGDGANDALAIKKADLGIAMFDGASATRQIASVVLTNNSFAELPGGVKLADNIIENIEIFSNIFLSQTFSGLFLFIFIVVFGYTYPFTPLNITFINYFTIGIPSILIFYWAMHPREIVNVVNQDPFLKRVVPFPFVSSISQSTAIISVFLVVSKYFKDSQLNTPVALTFIAIGSVFFLFVQKMHNANKMNLDRKIQFSLMVLVEIIILFTAFQIPFLTGFYNVKIPSFMILFTLTIIIGLYVFVQNAVTDKFLSKSVA